MRLGLGGFAIALTAFALLRNPAPAYPMAVIVGFCYFATVTSLSTVLQKRLDDSVRGRVMAIWVMAFGGAVAVGGLVAGPIIDWTSVTAVVLFGAAVAAVADLLRRPPRPRRRRRDLTHPADPEPPHTASGLRARAGGGPASRGRPPGCP